MSRARETRERIRQVMAQFGTPVPAKPKRKRKRRARQESQPKSTDAMHKRAPGSYGSNQ